MDALVCSDGLFFCQARDEIQNSPRQGLVSWQCRCGQLWKQLSDTNRKQIKIRGTACSGPIERIEELSDDHTLPVLLCREGASIGGCGQRGIKLCSWRRHTS